MQEGDARAVKADPWLRVDELEAGGAGRVQGAVDVGHGVSHVMQAGTTPGQELSHRRLVARRTQQLHLAVAGLEEGGLEAFRLARRPMHELRAKSRRVEADRFLHVGHSDADVVDAVELHCTEKTRVTALSVNTFGSRPSIFRLPRRSFRAMPRPTSST